MSAVDRPARTRTSSSRKCYACQCHSGTQESSRGVRRTSVKSNADVKKPKKLGPDVLPSVARAKSSVKLRPDALKNKHGKASVASVDTSATLEQEAATQETTRDVKEIAQVSQTPRVRRRPAVPPSDITTVKTTPRQILRKKVDPTPGKLKKAAAPEKVSVTQQENQSSDDSSYGYHITWDGFDEQPECRIGQDCCLCETDLAVSSSNSNKDEEFSTLPVMAMLPCGHAYHVTCLDQADVTDNPGEPSCVLCASFMSL